MKRRILFVDDEFNVLHGLQRMLRDRTGLWEMKFTTTAANAGELLREEPYDAAVLDVNMPGKNGLELLAEIKANPQTWDTEVVVLTGLEDRDLKRRALDLGALDLLNKPVLREDLVARLSNALRMKSYRDELRAQNAALEEQLLLSQKMEVVGTLAAGVAHDLNNVLSVIMGNSDLAAVYLAEDSSARKQLTSIQECCDHAKRLVQQVLGLANEKGRAHDLCDLGRIVEDSLELLKASIPRSIQVEWGGAETDRRIQADPTQLRQLLMNLCINASQAMDQGGVLRMSVGETELGLDSLPGSQEIQPGSYVKLGIADTGNGMDEGTLEHIFDPLFTTRGSQGGTGLGLSVVRRIVRDHAGQMTVESSPGKGTTFSIYLPCAGDSGYLNHRQTMECLDGGQETHSVR